MSLALKLSIISLQVGFFWKKYRFVSQWMLVQRYVRNTLSIYLCYVMTSCSIEILDDK